MSGARVFQARVGLYLYLMILIINAYSENGWGVYIYIIRIFDDHKQMHQHIKQVPCWSSQSSLYTLSLNWLRYTPINHIHSWWSWWNALADISVKSQGVLYQLPSLYHLEIVLMAVEIPFNDPYLDDFSKMHWLTCHIRTMGIFSSFFYFKSYTRVTVLIYSKAHGTLDLLP